MSAAGMVVIGLIYAASAVDRALKGNTGLALAFAGWSFGQFGMVWEVK